MIFRTITENDWEFYMLFGRYNIKYLIINILIIDLTIDFIINCKIMYIAIKNRCM